MKVLAIITHPEFGGTETHVLSLARMLRRRKIHMSLATYGGPFVPVMRQHGIRIHLISMSTSSTTAASSISKVVKRHGYTVIHAHDIESFRMLPHLRKQLPRVPRLMTVHGIYYSQAELRHAVNAANAVIAVSPSVRTRMIWSCHATNKVTLVPNGIDTFKYSPVSNSIQSRRKLGLPSQAHVCLYVGRFQSDKWGIARKVILAAERVNQRYSNFVTVLVGFGSYRSRLKKLAKQVNTRLGRVAIRVLPPTTQLQNYYRAATMVVGTGRVALEAMSCGKPVIAAGISGYEGIIDRKSWRSAVAHQFGDHGANQRTTVAGLSHDIQKLLSNPQFATSRGNFGRKMVLRQFSIQQAASMTGTIYHRVLRG